MSVLLSYIFVAVVAVVFLCVAKISTELYTNTNERKKKIISTHRRNNLIEVCKAQSETNGAGEREKEETQ